MHNGILFAASDSGVYRSTDDGVSWSKINSGLTPNTQVMSIITHENNLYIGTYEKGVWKRSILDPLTLNLKALIQGFYNPITNKMVKDTARVSLRSVSPPYAMVDSARTILDSNGVGNFVFTNAVKSIPYYIVLTHRNGIETWSAEGNSFISETLSYDFTIAASQAYGNNQILIGSKYCIYSGDVNQDGIIDGSDASTIDNDAFNFATGYLKTDLNGDEIIDGSDAAIADFNVNNFVGVIRP